MRLVTVDIGGTWTRVAPIVTGRLGSVWRVETESADRRVFLERLGRGLEQALQEEPMAQGVAVSVTGPVDPASGRLFAPPNTGSALAGLELGAWLADRTGLPVMVDRDTNCALLGEVADGAAKGAANVVFATISTGVGGAVLLDGRLLRGRDGVGGELGHVVVDAHGPRCGCGRTGCLEAIASGPAIARAAGVASGREASFAAQGGERRAAEALRAASDAVASACVDWVNAFNPELIVIGGSVVRAHPDWLAVAARAVCEHALAPASQDCPVVRSQLGDEVALIGAARLFEGGRDSLRRAPLNDR
jgi:glucokinase